MRRYQAKNKMQSNQLALQLEVAALKEETRCLRLSLAWWETWYGSSRFTTGETTSDLDNSLDEEPEVDMWHELPPTQSVPMSVPHQPMEAQPEAKLSCEDFDVIQVINGWQVLPAEHWSKIHMRFPASHYRLSARTPESAICYLKEFEQRRLLSGEKFRWLFGSATDHPTVRFGIILRCGHGRFHDQYRVQLDTQSKDEWRDMDKCWPDG